MLRLKPHRRYSRRMTINAIEAVSAGGVVLRVGKSGREVLLCGRKNPHIWALPKGTPEPGETREQVALREVNEETGLKVLSLGFVESIEYSFVRPTDGIECHKTVYFYLMSPVGGQVSDHDAEFDEVKWFSEADALTYMTYGNEVKVVEKSLSMAPG